MYLFRFTASALLISGFALTSFPAAGQSTTESNLAVSELHAKDQRVTRQIRKIMMEDASLAAGQNNVGIMTVDGMVFLRGTVTSEAAKVRIERHAINTAGISKVTSELKVVEAK